MRRRATVVGGGLAVVAGGGLLWLSLRPPIGAGSAGAPPSATTRRSSPGLASSGAPEPPLGSVPWADALRAALSRQWGAAAPALWAAPDPVRPRTWLALAPAAHAGRLWWAYATPRDPLPPFQSVPVSLDLTAAQIGALPPPVQGALNQAYDLMRDRPWPLTTALPPIAARGAMTATQAEARGVARAPVGWRVVWEPARPAAGTLPAAPAALNVVVTLPWQVRGYAPVLANEGMQWRTDGRLVSDGDVTISMNGVTLRPVPATDTAALAPASARAGLSGPGSGGS